MKDLTKIKKPFGLLKPEVQAALKAHGGPYEYFAGVGWEPRSDAGSFSPNLTYRVAPKQQPTPDQIDWSQLPVEFKWAARDSHSSAYAYTSRPLIDIEVCGWEKPKGRDFYIGNLSLYQPGTCDWKDSLQERPE